MAEQPTLHIDTDWKKQAQEEKRKLAEQEQKKRAAESAPGAAVPGAASPAAGRTSQRRGARELPSASFSTLVQSLLTQALFYMGELAVAGQEPTVNLDMAKHQIDTLAVLEEKTKGNLTPEEQKLLDGGLYEARMRFVALASEYI